MTPRPCKDKHPTPADFVGECHFCRLATTNPAYRSWAEPAAVKPPACPHRGEPTGERHECATCGNGRVSIPVLACAKHGKCTFARKVDGVACCEGCEDDPTRAKGYAPSYTPPARATDPFAAPVAIPTPPAFARRTNSRRAVVTVVAGEKGRAMWSITGPHMRAYAARLGAELVVSEWAGNPAWPMGGKFAIGTVAAAFDECIYADADVLFRPTTLDLFALRRDPAAVLAFNDLPHVLEKWTGLPEEYQRVRESQQMPRAPLPHYQNTGLVVMSRHHAPAIAPPAFPIPALHCAEQHLWVARLYESGCPVEWMTNDQHHQWWIEGTMRDAPPWAALHFSGMQDDARRLDEMRHIAGAI